MDHPAHQPHPEDFAATAAVDVVVPVYGGPEETRRCLESLLANPQATPFEIIVVNDASPDAAIRAFLAELSGAGRIVLIENEFNVGFVDSANLGLMAHPDRDVVLLNSDTEVHGDWLDRMRACARSHTDVATVTPFSNNATLCSYPRVSQGNALPAGKTAAELDDIFREVNKGRSAEIPTAVGFCVYFTRHGFNKVGFLDSLHYDRGYCEENDFSARAHGLGFRHLLCGDVFVFHQGGVSFGAGATALSEAAMLTFNRLHPHYWPLVAKHLQQDPQRELRRRVDIARLTRSGRPKILFIGDSNPGGAQARMQRLARLLEPAYDILLLTPADGGSVSLEWARGGEEFNAFFDLATDYELLLGFLRGAGTVRVDIHQTAGHERRLLDLLRDLGAPYDFTVHDYLPLCPFTYSRDGESSFCGRPDEAVCQDCYSGREDPAEEDLEQQRRFYRELLSGAERVLVPSRPAQKHFQEFFPGANVVRMTVPEAEPDDAGAASTPMLKVLILGDLSDENGLDRLEACAADAASRQLPIYFRVLGRPLRRPRLAPDAPLSFSGPVGETEMARLAACERADAVFFPGCRPQPDAITLGAAAMTGLTVVAPALEIFCERLDGLQARLFDPGLPPAGVNDELMRLQTGVDLKRVEA